MLEIIEKNDINELIELFDESIDTLYGEGNLIVLRGECLKLLVVLNVLREYGYNNKKIHNLINKLKCIERLIESSDMRPSEEYVLECLMNIEI